MEPHRAGSVESEAVIQTQGSRKCATGACNMSPLYVGASTGAPLTRREAYRPRGCNLKLRRAFHTAIREPALEPENHVRSSGPAFTASTPAPMKARSMIPHGASSDHWDNLHLEGSTGHRSRRGDHDLRRIYLRGYKLTSTQQLGGREVAAVPNTFKEAMDLTKAASRRQHGTYSWHPAEE